MSDNPVTPPTPHSGINPGSLTTSFSRKPCNPSPLGLNRAIPIPTRLKNPKMSCAKGTKKNFGNAFGAAKLSLCTKNFIFIADLKIIFRKKSYKFFLNHLATLFISIAFLRNFFPKNRCKIFKGRLIRENLKVEIFVFGKNIFLLQFRSLVLVLDLA